MLVLLINTKPTALNCEQLLQDFSLPLLAWYDQHGRKELPWQSPRHPYRVWISEIMLQQTQVQTVIPYFSRFMERFPTITDLALAKEDEVLSLWSGLGYYSRARNLHKTAQYIQKDYQGIIPKDLDALMNMPGIGPSTAAAIMSQAYNAPTAILDANVKRVLTRFFAVSGWPDQAQVKTKLWSLAQSCMPQERCAEYTQAIMDLGALCCTSKTPDCSNCPVQRHCQAFKNQTQERYPEKKIKKTIPFRQEQFLVLYKEQPLIYLEKRPPTGLWGGLWCLPNIEDQACPLEFIEKQYALKGSLVHEFTKFKHKFSHFTLEITALSIKTQALGHQVSEKSGSWFAKDQLPSLGLAKPTSLILSHFFSINL